MQTVPEKQVPLIKQLYETDECSAREIAQQLNYSIDAVYYILRKYNIERRTKQQTNQIRFKNKPASFRIKKPLSDFDTQLLISGTMLYWAEGYKTAKSPGIDFANSDPEMQKLFIHFLRKICNITESRLKIQLYTHSEEKIHAQIRYWSDLLQIPKTQFTKPYISPTSSLDKKDKMPYGLVHIRYYDKKLLIQILSWIAEYQKKLQ